MSPPRINGGMKMSLDGKTVYLTGATGGIGVPLLCLLMARGAKVSTYDRGTQGDLMEHIDTTCKSLRENTPDILINMAGTTDFNHAEHQDYDALLTLNLLVPMRLTQAVLPEMRKRNRGQIVNIGCMTGLIAPPHLTGYVAAKSGLKGFSDALRRELTGTQITISHIAPRAVHTPLNNGKAGILNRRKDIAEDNPLHVALRILKAIDSHETDVRIGWPERFCALINALLPTMIDRVLRKNAAIGDEILRSENNMAALALAPSVSIPAQAHALDQVQTTTNPAISPGKMNRQA
tara:strand:+ start:74815 stop:75690 length:876 start_codon:yes stop_codon:yes gene_type:complete